jgi:hypothetical protein
VLVPSHAEMRCEFLQCMFNPFIPSILMREEVGRALALRYIRPECFPLPPLYDFFVSS